MSEERCVVTDVLVDWCVHCREQAGADPMEDYEVVGPRFEAVFPGRCAVDHDHVIKRGDRIARVQKAANPMLPVPGVACTMCVKVLRRATR